jgi:hypothetical protein
MFTSYFFSIIHTSCSFLLFLLLLLIDWVTVDEDDDDGDDFNSLGLGGPSEAPF